MQERDYRSPEKIQVTRVSKEFAFWGRTFGTYRGKLLIKPSKKNDQAFLRNFLDHK